MSHKLTIELRKILEMLAGAYADASDGILDLLDEVDGTLIETPRKHKVVCGSPVESDLPGLFSPLYKLTSTHGGQYSAEYRHVGDYHPGIDIWRGDMLGAKIHAIADGDIVASGAGQGSWGGLVLLQHDDGMISRYGHVELDAKLAVGDLVKRGDPIGVICKTPWVPHLHLEVFHKNRLAVPGTRWDFWDARKASWGVMEKYYVDPAVYIDERRWWS